MDNAESTVVGETVLISGNLSGDEDLMVLGRVEGSIVLTRTLNVSESGIVKAEITVRNAVVRGVVVGNITASDSVQVTETGRLVGDLKAPRVIITAGARVRGQVDMGDLESPRPSGSLPVRTQTVNSLGKQLPGTTARPATLPPRRATSAVPTAARAAPAAKAAPPAVAPARAAAAPARAAAAPAPARPPAAAPATSRKIKKKVVVRKRG
jgi:cytoskeletal protein CcmA (bactofilin family)